jgi:acetoin utilization deacetylase AcuC-like enzyme
MKTVYSDQHRLQHGTAELSEGKLVPCFEKPERADIVLARIREQSLGDVIEPTAHGREPLLRVHTPPFVEFLETAWDAWVAEHGAYDALPLNWATRTFRHDHVPEAIDGKLSYYSLDAGTPIMSGTWAAASASADVALTGADLMAGGERHAFALCRPPGHHAASDVYGGYCFMNNAAIAAQALRDSGCGTVAVLDVDYHHGNGTQAIFYERSDVPFASIHGHPLQEYPYFLGFDDERGAGPGVGANANFPLRHGSGWDVYEPALRSACAFLGDHRPDALVVSLGVDTYLGDPISQFKLDHHHFTAIGEIIAAALPVPTLVVFEGGYAVAEIGINAVNVLEGLAG